MGSDIWSVAAALLWIGMPDKSGITPRFLRSEIAPSFLRSSQLDRQPDQRNTGTVGLAALGIMMPTHEAGHRHEITGRQAFDLPRGP
jgi:hypothetical protein